MKNILVIGCAGQIGSELVPALQKIEGVKQVIATDKRFPLEELQAKFNTFLQLDVLDYNAVEEIVNRFEIDTIYHLASLLSATSEKFPQSAWNLNMNGLINVLEVSRKNYVKQIMWPSSIAVFGSSTPKENTPNDTILQPSTMYGITKVTGELMIKYYSEKYDIDVRSVRLPGIISSETLPGGGTTDYAVEIFYEAIKNQHYNCFLEKTTILPMLYMSDCIKALIELMQADPARLKHRVFNLTGMSFSCAELAHEIRKHIPDFTIEYNPDSRQQIADSWPRTIDDSFAREEWDWNPSYTIESMSLDMIKKLRKRLL